MDSSFSIQAAAERSGLSPHVIRAWERRYGAIAPERSAGRHRLYSEAEVERLVLLHRAVRSGHSIGKIATLPLERLRALGESAAIAPSGESVNPEREDGVEALRVEALQSVRHFDAIELSCTLERGLLALGHQGLLRRGIAPLAQEVGEHWRAGTLTVAHEHFFSAAVKQFLGDLSRGAAPPTNAPCLIVATPPGQLHELGALMAAATASNLGWKVVYLGPNLPAHEIGGAAIANGAVAVGLSIVYPEDDPHLAAELTALRRFLSPKVRIMIGGRAADAYRDTLIEIGAFYGDSLEALGVHLDAVRREM